MNPPEGEGLKTKVSGSSGWVQWLPWVLLLVALILRVGWLGIKPPHFDEGVNGWWVDYMRKEGHYPYNPFNYHGPFHFYVLFLMQTLFGREVVAFRLPLVLINFATLVLLLRFVRYLPRRVVYPGAAAFAISAGMLFYSRYAIHEAWLLFALVLALRGAMEMWTEGSRRGLWTAAAGITLMVLTKETYIIHLFAFALAWETLRRLERFSPSQWPARWERPVPQRWDRRALRNTVLVCLLVIVFFYSGGFSDFSLLHGIYLTFSAWFETGVTRADHGKPWYYWLQILLRHEWPALIGLLYSVRALWPGMNRFSRYLAIYGCGTLVAYTLIPYKTPWCIIVLIWPFFILFGEAVAALGKRWPKVAVAATALVLAGALTDSLRLNFEYPSEPEKEVFVIPALEEPLSTAKLISEEARYIYVQTLNDIDLLMRPLEALVRHDAGAYHLPGLVILPSNHPLPWMLGDFTAVGYYTNRFPKALDANFLVVDEKWFTLVDKGLHHAYFVTPFQLRDGMSPGRIYLRASRFRQFFPGREPEFVPSSHGEGQEEAGEAAPGEAAAP